MVEAGVNANTRKCLVKHFPIDEKNSFAQYSVTVTEEEYNALTQSEAGVVANPGKNKILI